MSSRFYSAFLSLCFSIYFRKKGLDGFANWYRIQTYKEEDYMIIIEKYLQDNGERVVFKIMNKEPGDEFKNNIYCLIKASWEYKWYITNLINNVYLIANEIKDFKTIQFLYQFIKEQNKTDKIASELLEKITLFASDFKSLYTIDQELSKCIYKALSLE